MKINHSNEPIPHVGPGVDRGKVGGLEKTKDFASVLEEAAQDQKTDHLPVIPPGRAVRTVASGMDLNQKAGYEKTATLLLDTLEKYQILLADPTANLKQVQPLVDQMKITADQTENWIKNLKEDHTLKGVIEETLIQMNKEIVRFDRGEYIA